MKKIFSLIIIFCSFYASTAQVNIGKSRTPTNLYVVEHNDKKFNFFESTNTVFIVPDVLDLTILETHIKSIWTYNEIVFINQEEYDTNKANYFKDNLMLIFMENVSYQKVEVGTAKTGATFMNATMYVHAYTDIEKNKKGKYKYDSENVAELVFTLSNSAKARSKSDIDEPYVLNLYEGFVKNFMQILNDKLKARESLSVRDDFVSSKIIQLRKQKLYVSDWILRKWNPFTFSVGKERSAEEIFEDYQYEYELVDAQTLSDMILEGQDFLYLMHTQSNSEKILSIINAQTGNIVYNAHTNNSFNVKSNDIKALNKAIKKGK